MFVHGDLPRALSRRAVVWKVDRTVFVYHFRISLVLVVVHLIVIVLLPVVGFSH
jgi:hypothetical protein